jgi:hypothetical protein
MSLELLLLDQLRTIEMAIETSNARNAVIIANLRIANMKPNTMINFFSNAKAKMIAAATVVPRKSVSRIPIISSAS